MQNSSCPDLNTATIQAPPPTPQTDDPLDELIEEIRAAEYELRAADSNWMGEQK
jgi:hypothetical protein